MTDREAYMAVLASGPILGADAVVLLTGEGESRVGVAAELVARGAAPIIVITGGLDRPPYCIPAAKLKGPVMGKGVAPSAIIVDNEAMNTAEQARNTIALAVERGWKRLILVASPEHVYRAHLTFVHALNKADKADEILVLPVATPQPWWGVPDGLDMARISHLEVELDKAENYADCATWLEGLDYLRQWEPRLT